MAKPSLFTSPTATTWLGHLRNHAVVPAPWSGDAWNLFRSAQKTTGLLVLCPSAGPDLILEGPKTGARSNAEQSHSESGLGHPTKSSKRRWWFSVDTSEGRRVWDGQSIVVLDAGRSGLGRDPAAFSTRAPPRCALKECLPGRPQAPSLLSGTDVCSRGPTVASRSKERWSLQPPSCFPILRAISEVLPPGPRKDPDLHLSKLG